MDRTSTPAPAARNTCASHHAMPASFVCGSCISCRVPMSTIGAWQINRTRPPSGGVMAIEVKGTAKTSPAEVLEKARAAGVKVVDFRFVDLPGTWQHFSVPLSGLDEDVFTDGIGFDGSSIRGFQAIDESD